MAHDAHLADVTWKPALYTRIDDGFGVPSLDMSLAGPFNW